MKKKKVHKLQRKLLKGVKKLGKANNPAWVSALTAALGALATALGDRSDKLRSVAHEAKERLLPHGPHGSKEGEMPNGMVMKDQPGPV